MSDSPLRLKLLAIKAELDERSADGEAHLFLNIPYWQLDEELLAIPDPKPVDREALAKAAHHYFCIRRSEPNHEPRQSDYDKADEILEILALIPGEVL